MYVSAYTPLKFIVDTLSKYINISGPRVNVRRLRLIMSNISGIKVCDDGLTHTSQIAYDIRKGKRRLFVTKSPFSRTVRLTPPLFLTEGVWRRHGYTMFDIRMTLSYFSPVHLWQLALLNGISASNSAIKLAFATPESMVYGSKAIVIRKICKLMKSRSELWVTGKKQSKVRSVLSKLGGHVPPLPYHVVDHNMYEKLLANVPSLPVDMTTPMYMKTMVKWRDITFVPLYTEKNAIFCVRVIPRTTYETSRGPYKKINSLCAYPVCIWVNDVEYAGVDEAMYFFSYDTYDGDNADSLKCDDSEFIWSS